MENPSKGLMMSEEVEFKDVLEVWDETYGESDPDLEFEIIEFGDWISEHKWEYRSSIVKWKDAHYRIDETRSGSYYSDYHYDDPTYVQVVPEEVMIKQTIWKEVK